MIDLTGRRSAVLFPGQGAQFVGMAGPLRRSPEGLALLTHGERVLGRPIVELIASGPTRRLDETVNTQPAVFLVGLAFLEAYKTHARKIGMSAVPHAYCGHSLGQITACVAAGAIAFEDGVRLVARRAVLMEEAGRLNPGKMAAIIGLEVGEVERFCRAAAGVVTIANFNGPQQTVISGEASAIQDVCERAVEAKAKKVVALRISIGAHSPLMASAQSAFREELARIDVVDAVTPVVLNTTATLTTSAAEIRRELEEHLCGPVRWESCIDTLARDDVDLFVDVGPGVVVEKLVRHQLPTRTTVSVGFVQPIDRLVGRTHQDRDLTEDSVAS